MYVGSLSTRAPTYPSSGDVNLVAQRCLMLKFACCYVTKKLTSNFSTFSPNRRSNMAKRSKTALHRVGQNFRRPHLCHLRTDRSSDRSSNTRLYKANKKLGSL